jgi:ABC-type transport system involved in multi-copper enzyme maturation permease subunit
VYHYGDRLPLVLTGLLLGWIVLTFGIAYILFSRKGDS